MGFERKGYCNAIVRVGRPNVCHGNDRDHFAIFNDLAGGDDRAGPVLAAFLRSLAVLPSP